MPAARYSGTGARPTSWFSVPVKDAVFSKDKRKERRKRKKKK